MLLHKNTTVIKERKPWKQTGIGWFSGVLCLRVPRVSVPGVPRVLGFRVPRNSSVFAIPVSRFSPQPEACGASAGAPAAVPGQPAAPGAAPGVAPAAAST